MFIKMSKITLMSMVVLSGLGVNAQAVEQDNSEGISKITLQNEEVKDSVQKMATEEQKTTSEIYNQIYLEEQEQIKQDKEENMRLSGVKGGNNSSGKVHKINAKAVAKKVKVGDFYYTPSSTFAIQHGHVGIFNSSSTIIESVPKKGVISTKVKDRYVANSGSVLKRVNVSQAKRTAAAKWTAGRSKAKEKYSTNFATNRNTSHYGNKNCSKLVWSAYKVKAKIDLDKDKGYGVYPRDIRDAKQTTKVMNL